MQNITFQAASLLSQLSDIFLFSLWCQTFFWTNISKFITRISKYNVFPSIINPFSAEEWYIVLGALLHNDMSLCTNRYAWKWQEFSCAMHHRIIVFISLLMHRFLKIFLSQCCRYHLISNFYVSLARYFLSKIICFRWQ